MQRILFTIIVFSIISFGMIGYTTNKKNISTNFLLTSDGSAATTWLSQVLNNIHTVYCTHYNADLNGELIDVEHISVEKYFQTIKSKANTDSKYVGNVHGYILNMLQDVELPQNLIIANLIRHPITLLDSSEKFWAKKKRGKEFYNYFIKHLDDSPNNFFTKSVNHYTPSYAEALEYDRELQKKYKIDPSDYNTFEYWVFLINLGRFDRIHANMQTADALGIPQFKFEDYTQDPKTLQNIILYITNNQKAISNHTASRLVNIPAQNVTRDSKPSPEQIYTSWSDWKKVAFAIHIERIGGKKNNAYIQNGYELSFIEEKF